MTINKGIKCDVTSCEFNVNDCECEKNEIKVACDCGGQNCTCCASYNPR